MKSFVFINGKLLPEKAADYTYINSEKYVKIYDPSIQEEDICFIDIGLSSKQNQELKRYKVFSSDDIDNNNLVLKLIS